eukprot:7147935-Pyramimonas_sp.AAC.1
MDQSDAGCAGAAPARGARDPPRRRAAPQPSAADRAAHPATTPAHPRPTHRMCAQPQRLEASLRAHRSCAV